MVLLIFAPIISHFALWYEICSIKIHVIIRVEKFLHMKRIFSILLFSGLFISLLGQGKFTDPRDGNIYKTITVKGTTWMADNLRFKSPNGAYSFDKDSKNLSEYGILYEWETAVKVCPDGWHLPSVQEYQTLLDNSEQKHSLYKGPSDSISFGVQLAGMQDYEGTFSEKDESGYYWTSTEYNKENAAYFSYLVIIGTPVIDISRKEDIEDIHGAEKSNKYSVRCIKNN
jgi:uncharacterized protein (TIGR02145 family)